jgi:hypothetical protein
MQSKVHRRALAKLKVPTPLMTGDADLWIPSFLLREVGEARGIQCRRSRIHPQQGHTLGDGLSALLVC